MNIIESFFALLGFFTTPLFMAIIGGLMLFGGVIVGLMFMVHAYDRSDVARGILILVAGILVGGTLLTWGLSQPAPGVWG